MFSHSNKLHANVNATVTFTGYHLFFFFFPFAY